jgi:hypothetical protein
MFQGVTYVVMRQPLPRWERAKVVNMTSACSHTRQLAWAQPVMSFGGRRGTAGRKSAAPSARMRKGHGPKHGGEK